MKKLLHQIKREVYYYGEKGNKKNGIHNKIYGNVSEISGNVSGIYGNVNGIFGDINLCELTEEERKEGVKIEDLVMKD